MYNWEYEPKFNIYECLFLLRDPICGGKGENLNRFTIGDLIAEDTNSKIFRY